MAQDNVAHLGQAQENDPILEALNQTNKDRAALAALLGPLFKHVWTDFLDILFELLPHEKGDGSENEKIYNLYRGRVLNIGNRKIRELPMILNDFVLYQVRRREIVQRTLIQGRGPWNLPPGVKMPSEKPKE